VIKVGLTGGIGSGKTTVAKVFQVLSVPIYDSDFQAKKLLNTNEKLKSSIIDEFGLQSYNSQGDLNRAHLASVVFESKEALDKLNSIVHPAVYEDQKRWFASLSHPYGIVESALLYEIGAQSRFDIMIVVDADEELRIQRVMSRDKSSKEDVSARIKNQWPQSQKVALADFVVINDNKKSIIQQVIDIDGRIKAQINRK